MVTEASRNPDIIRAEHDGHRVRFDAALRHSVTREHAPTSGQDFGRLFFIGTEGYARAGAPAHSEGLPVPDREDAFTEAMLAPEVVAAMHRNHLQRFGARRSEVLPHHLAAKNLGEITMLRLSPEDVEPRLIDDEPNQDDYGKMLDALNRLDSKGDISALRYLDIYANNSLANANDEAEIERILHAVKEYIRLHDELYDTHITG